MKEPTLKDVLELVLSRTSAVEQRLDGIDGRLDGDTMSGAVAFGRIASGTWSATRSHD